LKNSKLTCLAYKPLLLYCLLCSAHAYSNEFDKSEQLLDKLNLEQSIAAVFNKVAYGSTTKRSIPDNAYPVTTLATPLLTTYRYSDGNDEWLRVDVKNNENGRPSGRSNVDFEPAEYDGGGEKKGDQSYGADLEKDHVLPTSAPVADILKNNNNKHYNNPNRYNNDRLRPDFQPDSQEQVTENVYKTTTAYNLLRNVRPTKSMYSKDIPSYVPPSRAFFTPPLPPEYQNPFADKPTLRGTNSDGFASRRPLPPPSLMPNKDRIPFRPDLPKVNVEKMPEKPNEQPRPNPANDKNEKKKTLNTPSQNVKLGEFYGLNRNHNESSFEYEKSYAPEPSITRILSGSNGRHDDIQIPDILYRAVTATPNLQRQETKTTKTRAPAAEPSLKVQEPEVKNVKPEIDEEVEEKSEVAITKKEVLEEAKPPDRTESVTVKKDVPVQEKKHAEDVTTQISDVVNLPNVKEKDSNVTKASSEEIWLICWNVHVYLVVFGYILLAIYSIYKLIRYEKRPPHVLQELFPHHSSHVNRDLRLENLLLDLRPLQRQQIVQHFPLRVPAQFPFESLGYHFRRFNSLLVEANLDSSGSEDQTGVPRGLRSCPHSAVFRCQHFRKFRSFRKGESDRLQTSFRVADVGFGLQLLVLVPHHQERTSEEESESVRNVHTEYIVRVAHHHRRCFALHPLGFRAAVRVVLHSSRSLQQRN
jgi:hypothetical protein